VAICPEYADIDASSCRMSLTPLRDPRDKLVTAGPASRRFEIALPRWFHTGFRAVAKLQRARDIFVKL
jgi:hypothetical protein